ncbi:unnamed protein product [Chironomus riparius]|uniref:Ionotropic receptor n=1 Tax=Chironomus riparius TaxID=315576 RepID=A0A9N9S7F2_9DIPT|nr:unnamed protein product [Chironomus riparius]
MVNFLSFEDIILELMDDVEVSAKAFNQVIDEFFTERQIIFDIVYFKSFDNLTELIDSILKQSNGNFSYALSSYDENLPNYLYFMQSAIFFLYSCNDIFSLHTSVELTNLSPKELKFLVFIQNCSLKELENSIDRLVERNELNSDRGYIEVFEYLLIDDENLIHLASIEWFTELACNQIQLVVLNTFDKNNQKWREDLENYEKFQNFYGCHLKMFLYENSTTCWERIEKTQDGLIPAGLKFDVFEIISKIANYSPDYNFNDSNFDIVFNIFNKRSILNTLTHMTTSFIESREIVVTTLGEPYTSYEKLWLPFDDATWMFLIFTFFIGFSSIFIIYRLNNFIQIGIFGSNIKTPSLNIVGTFFGIPQLKVPTNHIPRFLLIMFVFFCLIIRTCYQSKLFEFMTSTPRRSPPQTIQELKDNDFRIFFVQDYNDIEDLIEDEKMNWPQTYPISYAVYNKIFIYQSHNATAKIGLIIDEPSWKNFKKIGSEKFGFKIDWQTIPNYYLAVGQSGFLFNANNFFFHIFDETVQKLIPSGIMAQLLQNCFPFEVKSKSKKDAIVLSIEDLDFGFIIWLGCCAVCAACFVGEIFIWIFWRTLEQMQSQKCPTKVKFAKVCPVNTAMQSMEQKNSENLNIFRIQKLNLDSDGLQTDSNIEYDIYCIFGKKVEILKIEDEIDEFKFQSHMKNT